MLNDVKKRLAFDINSSIDNFLEVLLELYNEKYNDNLLYENITDYDITKFIKKECKDVFGEFINEKMLDKLKISEDAKYVVDYYKDICDIRFVSATFPWDVPVFYKLLQNNFYWLKTINFARIGDKQYYEVDLLCDDFQGNLINIRHGKGLLISRPWNKSFDNEKYGIQRIDNLNKNSIGVINNILNVKSCDKYVEDVQCFNCNNHEDSCGYPMCRKNRKFI